MSSPERKPQGLEETQGESKPEKIEVHVVYDSQRTTIKLKPSTKFEKIFSAIETKFQKQAGTFKFTYEGKRIQKHETAEDLGLENGDQIDAFLEQLGGAYFQAT